LTSINIAKTFVIACVLLFPSYYIISPHYRITVFSIALLVFVYLFFNKHILLTKSIRLPISKDTKHVIVVAVIFLLYMIISDILKMESLELLNDFLVNIFIIAVLPIFEDNDGKYNLLKVYILIFSFSMFFAIIQIFGLRENMGSLFHGIGIIKSDQMIQMESTGGIRISGAEFSVIGFAEHLAMLIILSYFMFIERKSVFLLIMIGISIIALFFTQVRAAIYSIGPAIIISQFVFGKKKVKESCKISMMILCIMIGFLLLETTIKANFPYFSRKFVSSDTHRFKVNYYISKGIWSESPIFGISRGEGWGMLSKYAPKLGKGRFSRYREYNATPTHHNQIGYYFRYYGLVGICLLIMLYITIFKKIMHSSSAINKMLLFSIFVFDFQYSMAHNNKVINNVILWIILSLASERIPGPLKKKEL